jgi:hypothetical protein
LAIKTGKNLSRALEGRIIMNVGRFLASAAAVWLVRVALNWMFYTRVIGQQSQQIAAAHPGIFRPVVPGLILTDLIFALAFTYLFVKVGAALGGGRMAGGNSASWLLFCRRSLEASTNT